MANNIPPNAEDILQQILDQYNQAQAYINQMREDQNGINSDNSKIASKITVSDQHTQTVVTKGGGKEHEIYYTSHQTNRYTPTQIKAFEADRDAKQADYKNEQALLNALPPISSLLAALMDSMIESQDGLNNNQRGNTGYEDFEIASNCLSQIFKNIQKDLINDAASQVLQNDSSPLSDADLKAIVFQSAESSNLESKANNQGSLTADIEAVGNINHVDASSIAYDLAFGSDVQKNRGSSLNHPLEPLFVSDLTIEKSTGSIPAPNFAILLNSLQLQASRIAASLDAPSVGKATQLLSLLMIANSFAPSLQQEIENAGTTTQNKGNELSGLFFAVVQDILTSFALVLPPELKTALLSTPENRFHDSSEDPIGIGRIRSDFQKIISYTASVVADIAGAAAVFKLKDRIRDAAAVSVITTGESDHQELSSPKEIIESKRVLPVDSISLAISQAVGIAAGSAANASFRTFIEQIFISFSGSTNSEKLAANVETASSHAGERVLSSFAPIAGGAPVQTPAAIETIAVLAQTHSDSIAINTSPTAPSIQKDETESYRMVLAEPVLGKTHGIKKAKDHHAAFVGVARELMQWSIRLTENGTVSQAAAAGAPMNGIQQGKLSQGFAGTESSVSSQQERSSAGQPESIQAIAEQGSAADLLSQFLEQLQKQEDAGTSGDGNEASTQENMDLIQKSNQRLSELAV